MAGLVSRVNVIYLYVRDLERSLAFYRGVLGIPLEREGAGSDWAEAALSDGVRFALHATGSDERLGSGTLRVDLEVADIDEAAERLRAAGVRVGAIEREHWGSACKLVDSDGYVLHLFQPPTQSSFDNEL